MNSLTQIKIFQHEDAVNVNIACNDWLIANKSKLTGSRIDIKYSGEYNSTAGYLCSIVLIISNLNPASKNWEWNTSSGDFKLDTC